MKPGFLAMILCVGSLTTGCTHTPPPPDIAVYGQMDKFLEQLAERAGTHIGSAGDFRIVVTRAAFPIGTQLHVGSTRPIDFNACVPTNAPPKFSAPNLFPSYELSKSLAVDLGFDNDLIKKLADFGVTVKDTDKIGLSVKSAKVQTLADNDLSELLAKAACKKSIRTPSFWLVRGYISGQRSFVLSNEGTGNVKGNLEKIASFNVDVGSGKAALSITDENETAFLQIVSQVDMVVPHVKGIKAITPTAVVTKPRSIDAPGRVYVQNGQADSARAAKAVAAQLQAVDFAVSLSNAKIDYSSLPLSAQVRYFNDSDKPDAQKALHEVQKQFPDATLVNVGAPAPTGQLEVWLPRPKI